MVYCGKPSGGCHACREKKTRCDQVPEGCTQCARAKRKCPGYRSTGDVIFRNESENVIRKFKAKEARAKAATTKPFIGFPSPTASDKSDVTSDTASGATSAESGELIIRSKSTLSVFSLATNIEDQATCYFVANWVVDDVPPSRGHLDYLASVCREDEADVGLLAAMKAVGLAGFAHANHAPSLLKSARYQYVQALKKTNAALESPVYVKKDSLLISIMVLSIFETATGCNPKSLDDWAEHVRGAAALLKLRGTEQLKTVRGRRMFIQVASSLMIICLQQDRPLPPFIAEWTVLLRNHTNSHEPALLAQEAMMQFVMFNAKVRDGSISDPQVIIARSLELDGIILSIFTSKLPSGWEYQKIYTTAKADCIYNGCYHMYFNSWISQIWNSMRTLRVMLNELIRETLLKAFSSKPPLLTGPEYVAQYQISTDVLYEMQDEILATVPQHLGYVSSSPNSDGLSGTDGLLVPFSDRDNFPTTRLSGPYFLIWPLMFVGTMDIATEDVKKFVTTNLRNIGITLGLQQAIALAGVVEKHSQRMELPR